MNQYLKFTYSFLVYIAVIGAAQWLYNNTVAPSQTHHLCWVILGIVSGITALSHYYLIYTGKKDPKVFIRSFMGVNTLKIFIYLAFMTLYAFNNKAGAKVFIGHFAAYYFLFSAFEITMLSIYLKVATKKPV